MGGAQIGAVIKQNQKFGGAKELLIPGKEEGPLRAGDSRKGKEKGLHAASAEIVRKPDSAGGSVAFVARIRCGQNSSGQRRILKRGNGFQCGRRGVLQRLQEGRGNARCANRARPRRASQHTRLEQMPMSLAQAVGRRGERKPHRAPDRLQHLCAVWATTSGRSCKSQSPRHLHTVPQSQSLRRSRRREPAGAQKMTLQSRPARHR